MWNFSFILMFFSVRGLSNKNIEDQCHGPVEFFMVVFFLKEKNQGKIDGPRRGFHVAGLHVKVTLGWHCDFPRLFVPGQRRNPTGPTSEHRSWISLSLTPTHDMRSCIRPLLPRFAFGSIRRRYSCLHLPCLYHCLIATFVYIIKHD